jgi:hypothetical protein
VVRRLEICCLDHRTASVAGLPAERRRVDVRPWM